MWRANWRQSVNNGTCITTGTFFSLTGNCGRGKGVRKSFSEENPVPYTSRCGQGVHRAELDAGYMDPSVIKKVKKGCEMEKRDRFRESAHAGSELEAQQGKGGTSLFLHLFIFLFCPHRW